MTKATGAQITTHASPAMGYSGRPKGLGKHRASADHGTCHRFIDGRFMVECGEQITFRPALAGPFVVIAGIRTRGMVADPHTCRAFVASAPRVRAVPTLANDASAAPRTGPGKLSAGTQRKARSGDATTTTTTPTADAVADAVAALSESATMRATVQHRDAALFAADSAIIDRTNRPDALTLAVAAYRRKVATGSRESADATAERAYLSDAHAAGEGWTDKANAVRKADRLTDAALSALVRKATTKARSMFAVRLGTELDTVAADAVAAFVADRLTNAPARGIGAYVVAAGRAMLATGHADGWGAYSLDAAVDGDGEPIGLRLASIGAWSRNATNGTTGPTIVLPSGETVLRSDACLADFPTESAFRAAVGPDGYNGTPESLALAAAAYVLRTNDATDARTNATAVKSTRGRKADTTKAAFVTLMIAQHPDWTETRKAQAFVAEFGGTLGAYRKAKSRLYARGA